MPGTAGYKYVAPPSMKISSYHTSANCSHTGLRIAGSGWTHNIFAIEGVKIRLFFVCRAAELKPFQFRFTTFPRQKKRILRSLKIF